MAAVGEKQMAVDILLGSPQRTRAPRAAAGRIDALPASRSCLTCARNARISLPMLSAAMR
jgi:hypothetical protein